MHPYHPMLIKSITETMNSPTKAPQLMPMLNQLWPGGMPPSLMQANEKQAGSNKAAEKCTFSQHLDVEKVLGIKCTVVVCYKMRNKRFLMKLLPREVVKLQEFIKAYDNQNEKGKIDSKKIQARHNHKLLKQIDIKCMDAWINLPPQLSNQNFCNCYGIIKIGQDYYTMSDLIEDNQELATEKNEYENQKLAAEYRYKIDTNEDEDLSSDEEGDGTQVEKSQSESSSRTDDDGEHG